MKFELQQKHNRGEVQILKETESLCPVCLHRISAYKIAKNGNVYLYKQCPEHGNYEVLLWRSNLTHYIQWGKYGEEAVGPYNFQEKNQRGCPFDCGLCDQHKANACSVVMEITQRCNLRCPICFANAITSRYYEPDLERIRLMYQKVIEISGYPTIQLSGGEPTMRDDLAQIISLGIRSGFEHVMINTNGIKIADQKDYIRELIECGLGTVYLQFDGVSDDIYLYTRGSGLLQRKINAIRNCAEYGVGVVLVVTLVPGVNDHKMWNIIEFAKQWIPTVRGVHFQPVSYIGRYPQVPDDNDRITIPDVIDGLVKQSKGQLCDKNFIPRRSEDSHCSFSCLCILDKNNLVPISMRSDSAEIDSRKKLRHTPWESARSYMNIHWKVPQEKINKKECCSCSSIKNYDRSFEGLWWDEIFEQINSHGLSITCMPFQDVWTIDIDRLQRCCGHLITPDLYMVPFCAFYLTSMYGEKLYPRPFARSANESCC